MKKILLSLGTLATVVAPIATVVACGSDSSTERDFKWGYKTSDVGPANRRAIQTTGILDGAADTITVYAEARDGNQTDNELKIELIQKLNKIPYTSVNKTWVDPDGFIWIGYPTQPEGTIMYASWS